MRSRYIGKWRMDQVAPRTKQFGNVARCHNKRQTLSIIIYNVSAFLCVRNRVNNRDKNVFSYSSRNKIRIYSSNPGRKSLLQSKLRIWQFKAFPINKPGFYGSTLVTRSTRSLSSAVSRRIAPSLFQHIIGDFSKKINRTQRKQPHFYRHFHPLSTV